MAAGLTGREDVTRGVVRWVMKRSFRALPSWRNDAAPTRWFAHHTVLTARRSAKHQPEINNDLLLNGVPNNPAYAAFIRALRSLPIQQREAFILTYGEKIDIRAVAVAMDCSTAACANHLNAATDRLRELAPDRFESQTRLLNTAYQTLNPSEEISLGQIRQRYVRPWMIRRRIRTLLSL